MDLSEIRKRDQLPDFLSHRDSKRFVEVGVLYGDFLRKLLEADPDLMVGVDIWQDDGTLERNDMCRSNEELNNSYRRLCQRYLDCPNIKFFRLYSHEASDLFEDESLDFVYLDADHTYEAVKLDLSSWWPKIKEDGILAGHDYAKVKLTTGVTFGVVEAVDEFVEEKDLILHLTSEELPTWIASRR